MGHRSRNTNPRFHFSAYWRAWSLLLSTNCEAKPGYGPTVEIDLSPINNDESRVRLLNVRRHCTDLGRGDRRVNELPVEIAEQFVHIVGEEVASFILNTDASELLSLIDFEKYHAVQTGGASLYNVIRDDVAHLLPKPAATTTRIQPVAGSKPSKHHVRHAR
ncbi:hypothetical protein [Erythrobacter aureus]|uniref:Uncharacterized protein n=1 Tax=Erythrobacter aureus TaxID=2182384 RepID=A0A345YIP2_9SPHN|nr:hypothetical protein [Erythrobacter aureus]AXK43794.1 hypothetical protein DVR09_15165 [Erythrobacter aureus]